VFWAIITIAHCRRGSLWKLPGKFWLSGKAAGMRARFGDCLFDSDTRELFRGRRPVHVSPKAFALLEILLAERPKAVSKERLHEKLWPRTFVSEANLASLAAEARQAIGDSARGSKLLRTVYGFGYAFSGEVFDESPAAAVPPPVTDSRFRIVRDEQETALSPGDVILGRDPNASIRIDDSTVSRRHAVLRVTAEDATIEDLGSKNGTLVEGKKVGSKPVLLGDGDEIQLGSVFLTFRVVSPAKSTRTLRNRRPH
jgi:DNA-binding winged helix-turn-helix (wHTH) protein